VPVDRDETLKKAEKLLKQGKLAGAIEEYVRLVEDRPADWNLANALGDLYIKAGDMDRAAAQFTRVADHLYGEGFLPRAAAVYKKVLKVRSHDDHALWQLADIAGRQGVGVDARAHYARLIQERRAAGNEAGAVDCIVRVGQLQDADVDARRESARILIGRGDPTAAAGLLAGVGDLLVKEGRLDEARDALTQAASLNPASEDIRTRLEALGPVEAEPEPVGEPDTAGPEAAPVMIVYEETVSVVQIVSDAGTADESPAASAADQDPAAVLAEVVGASDVPQPTSAAEPLLLESVFEELTDRVAREQEEREREREQQ
jgi:tetratricopeptide (TPR) repeat protein